MRVSPKGKSAVAQKPSRKLSKNPPKKGGTGVAASRQEYPLSTNVSSPIQAASRRRIAQYRKPDSEPGVYSNGYSRDDFVTSDYDVNERDESEDESDSAFEDVREAGKPRNSKKRQLGPPITTDEKLERLNDIHRCIVDEFLVFAKKESERVCLRLKILRFVVLLLTVVRS